MPNNSRAYCYTHGYFAKKTWKTPEEAEADRTQHLIDDPGASIEIEEKQTAGEMRESLLQQKFFIKSALELLSTSTSSDSELVGACVVKLPTGEAKCYQLSEKDCKALDGTYVGGSCQ